MKYRLPFVFSQERFENALICIISRFRPILNFSIFRKNGASLELLNIVTVFENSLPKGSSGEIKRNSNFLNCMARDSRQLPTTALIDMNRSDRFCFPPFFFLFLLYPALCSCTIGSFLPCVWSEIEFKFVLSFTVRLAFFHYVKTQPTTAFITKQNNKNNNQNTHALYWQY